MGEDKGVHIGFLIHAMDKLFFKNMQHARVMAGLDDLDGIHGWVLGYLYRNRDAEIYQKHLEAEFSVGRSTVTNIVKALENSGYIIRKEVPEDARLKKLTLTEEGTRKVKDTIAMFEQIDHRQLKDISQQDLETFLKVLEQIKKNTEKMMGETTLC